MNETKDETKYVTAGDLAKRMKRSTYGVKSALRRLGISPIVSFKGMSLYSPDVEASLTDSMRAPNSSKL